ncbi:hypothetical protein ACFL45_07795 [Candidatus Neomarinimicrobiota bacterium]
MSRKGTPHAKTHSCDALISFTLSPLTAQVADTDSTAESTPRKWALQLARNDGLSVLRHTGPNAALRIGFNASLGFSYPQSISHITRYDLGVEVHYLLLKHSAHQGSFYLGGGPLMGVYHYYSEHTINDSTVSIYDNWTWRFGAKGIVGICWRLGPRLALFIENQAYLTEYSGHEDNYYRIGEVESEDNDKNRRTESRLNYSVIGATWYFR